MFVAKQMMKIQLSLDKLIPPAQRFIVTWFIGTTGLTMSYYFINLAKEFYIFKVYIIFQVGKGLSERQGRKNIKAYQEDFYYIVFKCKLTIFPERTHSVFQFE